MRKEWDGKGSANRATAKQPAATQLAFDSLAFSRFTQNVVAEASRCDAARGSIARSAAVAIRKKRQAAACAALRACCRSDARKSRSCGSERRAGMFSAQAASLLERGL